MQKEGDRAGPSTAPDVLNVVEQMDGLMALGETLIKSGMLPKTITTREAAVAIILKGRELGLGVLEAFSSIHIIAGRPTVSPQLMMALAERSGELEDCQVSDDGSMCAVTVKRLGRSSHTATFSMEDARSLGLLQRPNWKTMPRVMRQWRAVAAAFRPVFADRLSGLCTPDEVGASVDAEGIVIVDEENECRALPDDHEAPMDKVPSKLWSHTEEAKGFQPFFDKAKEMLGGDEYHAVLGINGCKSRKGIATREQAMAIVKTFRSQGVSLKSQGGHGADLPREIRGTVRDQEPAGLALPQDLIDRFVSRPDQDP